MRSLLLLPLVLLLGCAGVTTYEIQTPDGITAKVRNSKDYETFSLTAEKAENGSWKVMLDETGVSASNPLKAAQEANQLLLDTLIKKVAL